MLKLPLKMPTKIVGERVYLEKPPVRLSVAKEIFEGAQESLKTQGPWCPYTPKDNEKVFMKGLRQEQKDWDTGKLYDYIIRDKKTKKLLGFVNVRDIMMYSHSGELGYWLRQSAVGYGYCQEALKLIEKACFTAGLNRLVIKTDALNKRSSEVARRANYKLDGVLRDDSWVGDLKRMNDSNFYTKLKREWEKQTKNKGGKHVQNAAKN